MSMLKELREKRGKLIHDARVLLDTAKNEKRELTEEESTAWDKLMNDSDDVKVSIEREERQVEADREAASKIADIDDEHRAGNVDEDEFRALAFRKALVTGFRDLDADEKRALQFTTDSAGGYLAAPEQFVSQLLKDVDNAVFIRQLATVQQINGAHSLGVPSLANDPADSEWQTELSTGTEDSTMSFGKRELNPNLLVKLIKVSRELLLRSALPAEQIVRERLAYKVGVTAEKAFMTGTGAGQPLGLFTASANGISTGRDVSTGNATTSIKFDGLKEAMYSVVGQHQMNGVWVFHRDGVKQISKLKDGEGQYLWQPSVTESDVDRLLGRPVYQSEYAPNTFTTGQYVGLFGDMSYYWIADALNLDIQRLDELYAATNQVGFVSRIHFDGMPTIESAFARVKLA